MGSRTGTHCGCRFERRDPQAGRDAEVSVHRADGCPASSCARALHRRWFSCRQCSCATQRRRPSCRVRLCRNGSQGTWSGRLGPRTLGREPRARGSVGRPTPGVGEPARRAHEAARRRPSRQPGTKDVSDGRTIVRLAVEAGGFSRTMRWTWSTPRCGRPARSRIGPRHGDDVWLAASRGHTKGRRTPRPGRGTTSSSSTCTAGRAAARITAPSRSTWQPLRDIAAGRGDVAQIGRSRDSSTDR
jgi:hypothetical protein